MRANVEIIHEARTNEQGDWNLCFQWVKYVYDNNDPPEKGYRFIWRRPDESLQAAMGQARIPNAATIFYLIQKATEDGWFITAESE